MLHRCENSFLRSHFTSCFWYYIYDLTGSTTLKPNCSYLKTVGSGIPGSAPRLKPVSWKQKEELNHTDLYLRKQPRNATVKTESFSSGRAYYGELQASSIENQLAYKPYCMVPILQLNVWNPYAQRWYSNNLLWQ